MAYSLENRGRPLRRARRIAGRRGSLRKALRRTTRGQKKSLFAARLLKRRGRLSKRPGYYVSYRKGRKGRKGKKRYGKSSSRPKARAAARRKEHKRKAGAWIKFLKSKEAKALPTMAAKRAAYWAQHPKQQGPKQWSPASALGQLSLPFAGGPVSSYVAAPPSLSVANPLALLNRGRGKRSRRNGLALYNPMGGLVGRSIGYATAVAAPAIVISYSMSKAAPWLQSMVYDRASDLVARVPVLGAPAASVISAAPHAITGSILGVAFGAAFLPAYRISPALGAIFGAAAGASPIIGFFIDSQSIMDAIKNIPASIKSGEPAADPAAAPMAGLAWKPLGGLAYEGGQLNGLAYEGGRLNGPFGDALGDGMYYETAPLSTPMSALNYQSASLADAAYSGADFSVTEGQAILNGTFAGVYGLPSARAGSRASGPSHLAGRPGHRWGWLFKQVGPQGVRKLASLSPGARVKQIAKLRNSALTAANVSAAQSKAAAQADVASAWSAGSSTSAAGGLPSAAAPAGASGPSGPLGAALFMGD